MTPAQLLYQKLELLLTTTPREIKLAAQEIWSGELVPGTQIICKQGIVWLTQSNISQDHILHHGQQFLITNPGKVVIQALASAAICQTFGGQRREINLHLVAKAGWLCNR